MDPGLANGAFPSLWRSNPRPPSIEAAVLRGKPRLAQGIRDPEAPRTGPVHAYFRLPDFQAFTAPRVWLT